MQSQSKYSSTLTKVASIPNNKIKVNKTRPSILAVSRLSPMELHHWANSTHVQCTTLHCLNLGSNCAFKKKPF